MKKLYCTYTHGNENPPKEIVKGYKTLVANPKAKEIGIRYVETDLNRSFGVKNPMSYEEQRALEIKKIISQYDIVYDVHRTVAPTAKFIALITNKEHYKNTLEFRPEAVVLIDAPSSLIAHCKIGIALEYPKKYTLGENNPPLYVVVSFEEANKEWVDFQSIERKGEILYPLMVGETAYNGKCFLLKKAT